MHGTWQLANCMPLLKVVYFTPHRIPSAHAFMRDLTPSGFLVTIMRREMCTCCTYRNAQERLRRLTSRTMSGATFPAQKLVGMTNALATDGFSRF
mmetsp:Transcript_62506/g.177511  ORF Transcript_62506/g.177511 Transcript_62506/m.177511 type:complete len:95 (+) Transcript_62506:54-338(+)